MKNTAKKGLKVLAFAALFVAGALTLASCDLINDIRDWSSNDSGRGADVTYTVYFSANGGYGTPPNAIVVYPGLGVTLPNGNGVYRSGYHFGGWNTNNNGTGINYPTGSTFIPTSSITLYAKWEYGYGTAPDDELDYIYGIANKVEWLHTNAERGGSYIIELRSNENTGLLDLSFGSRTNITVTVRGVSTNRTISLSSNGNIFYVGRGVTLILDHNVILRGRGGNTYPLVYINGGTLVMNNGSSIVNNGCRGVEVDNGGSLLMNGGSIYGNSISYAGGGGVAVWNGAFTMNGGIISGNSAGWGGGVAVWNGAFTMNAGTISTNYANEYGGGVAVFAGTFTKIGGTITGSDDTSGNRSQLGNAIYAYGASGGYRTRETTAGPGVSLFYNSNGVSSGWWDY